MLGPRAVLTNDTPCTHRASFGPVRVRTKVVPQGGVGVL